MSEKQKPRLLFGGVFATHTEWDEHGNVVERDEFHTRLYWELWTSGAMKKLKGARLHVLLTIVQHCDKNAEGFPSVRRLEELLPYNKDSINKAIKELIELGFLERSQGRGKKGKFGNNEYKIRYVLPCPKNTDTEESEEKQGFSPCPKNTDAVKTGDGKVGHKEDHSFKKDPSFKKDIDDDSQPADWETDSSYSALRQVFVASCYNDIKKPADHHDKLKNALKETSLQNLLIQAGKYIQAVKERRHKHKTAQIVWFLSDGWKNDFDKKEEKPAKQQRKAGKKAAVEEKLPQALTMQDETQQPEQNDVNRETKEQIFRLKQDLMNARFALRDAKKYGKSEDEINRLSAQVEQLEKELAYLENKELSA